MVIGKILLIGLSLLLTQPALSQELGFDHIQKLSAAINSEAEESFPLLSPDGKTLYFTRFMHPENAGGKFSGQDIWASKFNGTDWSNAANVAALNNKNNNGIIGISNDGKTLYLLNASSSKQLRAIFFSKMVNGNWSRPELIPIDGMEHEGFIGFYVSPDFEVILLSMKGIDSKGEEDLYVCLKNQSGQWTRPKNLGTAINTTGFEISPFLSSDKKRLYFSSNGHLGLGDADIFYSERLYNSWETWTTPRNLGEGLNSKSFDGYFSIYGDTLSYFVSNRANKVADIYKANVNIKEATDAEHILTENEKILLFEIDISSTLSFSKNSETLLPPHKELLWYIGSKLIGKTDIKVALVVSSHASKKISEQRIAAIVGYLALAGIEGSRIIKPDYDNTDNKLSSTDVNLLFIK